MTPQSIQPHLTLVPSISYEAPQTKSSPFEPEVKPNSPSEMRALTYKLRTMRGTSAPARLKKLQLSYEVAYHHYASGRFERAARWLRRAYKICGDNCSSARCAISERQGDVCMKLDQFSAAKRFYKASIANEQALALPDPVAVFRRSAKLAQVYFLQENLEKASQSLITRGIWFEETYFGTRRI